MDKIQEKAINEKGRATALQLEQLMARVDFQYNRHQPCLVCNEKYKHHIENNLKGGVCDMTMYYLIDKLNLIDVQNLMKPVQDKLGNSYIFVNNINLPEGYFGKQNFKFSRKKVKIIEKKYIYDEINNQKVSIAGIHFQGTAKRYLNKFTP